MALCSFSSNLSMDSFTIIDNTFISEFLPQANSNAIKVYLYGRFLCSTPHEDDNTLESMQTALGISVDEIIDSFSYWQQMGLVELIKKEPLEVKYLPIKQFSGSSKLRAKDKYADFNAQAQSFITGRQIQPYEYNEYYTLIETYHFEPEAVLMIIKYCTLIKNGNINYPYILTVAKSFEKEGIKTATALEEKMLEQEKASVEIKAVLLALGIKRDADLEERNLYLKWTSGFGFTQGVILEVAKAQNKTGGMHKLDTTLSKYFEQKLFSIQEIEANEKERENLFLIAKDVTRKIGVYYQVFDGVVENYVINWVGKGYTAETLNQIASYCLAMNIKTLDMFDETINRFFKLGLVSTEAINQYIDEVVLTDNQIKEILSACGMLRNVTSSDRECYKIWTETWNLPKEVIIFAANECKTKEHPMAYLNKLLSDFFATSTTTIEKAKEYLKTKIQPAKKAQQPISNFGQREYSKQALSALFDNLDDINI